MPLQLKQSATPHLRAWLRDRKRFILAAGQTAHGFGLGRLVGNIYALLFLSGRSLCLDEIAAGLSISKASASITLRRLAAWKLVQRVPVEEGRRYFYRIDSNFSRVIREGVLPMAQTKIASAGVMLEAMLRSAPVSSGHVDTDSTESPSDDGEVLQLLKDAKALQEKLSFFLNSGLVAQLL